MLAVAFIGHARTTRQNRMQAIVAAFLLAMTVRLGGLAGTNVVALRASAIWIVYAIPIGAVLIALGMLASRAQLRPPSKLGLKMQALLIMLGEPSPVVVGPPGACASMRAGAHRESAIAMVVFMRSSFVIDTVSTSGFPAPIVQG